tara:strand:+ start:413 stop:892 length:480 start_codon:yes stop_codon:yes gene_type:complete
MLNSKSNNTKLIMETWRRFLNEEVKSEDSSNIKSIINKMADQIHMESIKEDESSELDRVEFASVILALTFITAGLAVPTIADQMAEQKINAEYVDKVVEKYDNKGVSCGAGPFQMAQDAARLQLKTTFTDGDENELRNLSGEHAGEILKNIQIICSPGL